MRSLFTNFIPLLLLFAVYPQLVSATAANYTIDDTNGDARTGQKVIYQPSFLWGTQSCHGCVILPDVSQIMDRTYHEATSVLGGSGNLHIMMNFSGTAIFIFFTLVDNPTEFDPAVTTTTALDFLLDQTPLPSFKYTPKGHTTFLYQFPVLAKDGLTRGNHTLVISGSPTGTAQVYINFDYAIYTHDNDPQSVPSSPPIPTALPASSNLQQSTEVPQDHSQFQSSVAPTVSPDPSMDVTKTIVITTMAPPSTLSLVNALPSVVTPTSAIPEALTNTKEPTKVKAGTIAGILIGVLAFLGGSVPLTRYIWRQRKFRRHKEDQKEAVRFYREKLVRRVYPVQ